MVESVSVAGSQESRSFILHDVDQLNHAVSGSNLELIQLRPGRLHATVAHRMLGDSSLDYGRINLPLRVQGGLDPQRFGVGMFPAGARATWNGNHADHASLLFFTPGRELNGFLAGGSYGWTSLVLPSTWVESLASGMWRPASLQLATECRCIRPDPLKLAELWQAVAATFILHPGVDDTADMAEWLTTDLRNAFSGALSVLDRPRGDIPFHGVAHFDVARRAERYMRERITEPLCVDEVCTALRVSRRYLEYSFTDAFGTSPSRYLRLARLHEVRRRLKAPGEKTTVTHEAFSLGFNHLSLFSVQYKKAFGESPKATLAAALR